MHYFYIMVLLVFLSLHFLCGGVFLYFFPSKFSRLLFWILPLFGTFLILASFAVNRRAEGYFGGLIAMLGHYWTGIIFIIFSVAVVMVLCQLLFSFLNVSASYYIGRAGVLFMALFSIIGIIGGQTPPAVKHITITSETLPVEKLTIVQISDTHLGTGVRIGRVKDMVRQINELEPDLILVTGDFYENGHRLRAKNEAALREMKAKHGIYGSLGNHEFYGGLAKNEKFYADAGVMLLRQQSVEVLPGITVSGVDDFNTAGIKAEQFDKFLSGLNQRNYNILMEHEPKYFDVAEGKVDLMLCGHTHDGQLFPFRYIVKLRYPHVYGLYTKGKTNFYVTSGVFYWGPPMRLFSRNEIPVITIVKK